MTFTCGIRGSLDSSGHLLVIRTLVGIVVLANIDVIDKLRFALLASVRMRARPFGSIRESWHHSAGGRRCKLRSSLCVINSVFYNGL